MTGLLSLFNASNSHTALLWSVFVNSVLYMRMYIHAYVNWDDDNVDGL